MRSAGTFAVDGQPASGPAVRVGRRHGLDLGSHRSRPLDPDHVAWADVVVGMTPAHLDAVLVLRPVPRAALATEFLPAADPRRGSPVPDPFGATEEDYERTLDLLARCVTGLLDVLAGDDRAGGGERRPEEDPAP